MKDEIKEALKYIKREKAPGEDDMNIGFIKCRGENVIENCRSFSQNKKT